MLGKMCYTYENFNDVVKSLKDIKCIVVKHKGNVLNQYRIHTHIWFCGNLPPIKLEKFGLDGALFRNVTEKDFFEFADVTRYVELKRYENI